MTPRRVWLATALAFCLHGLLILLHQYRLSYDAYNHMFFADHYRLDWWSLWEPRWYTGFTVLSYPPLVHQLIGLSGRVIGVDSAYALISWIVLSIYPLAIYAFSRIFVGRAASSYAALGGAFLPSLFLTAHVYGQLPTLTGTLFALLGAAVTANFLRNGGRLVGLLAVFLFANVMAAHHATLLFLPWLLGAVFLRLFLVRRLPKPLLILRGAVLAALTALSIGTIILPFWLWGAQQTIQTPIDHASRHSYFIDPSAALLFFLPMYGLLIPLIPFALWHSRHKRFVGLGLSFLFLFLLGLGDTTPLPRLFFGQGWAWLTYDRFAFWASLILLIFFGVAVVYLKRKYMRTQSRWEKIGFGSLTLTALIIGFTASWLPTQPPQLDMQPIVDFLAQGKNDQWRYVTFGFGDQFAYLSRLTPATTIDGSYHTARSLPELRESGIGQIDSAYWIPNGLTALDPILQKSDEHGVRWGFVNLKFYIPVLQRNGWQKIATLSNGVDVWENPKASLPLSVAVPEENLVSSFAWGAFPLLSLFVSGVLALRCYQSISGEKFLSALQALALGLLPIGLTFWYYRDLFVITQPRIYFTYTDAIFFLSDGLAFVIVFIWLVRQFTPNKISASNLMLKDLRTVKTDAVLKTASVYRDDTLLTTTLQKAIYLTQPATWLVGLALLASLSIFWSLDWRTSLYFSLHLWLVVGLYHAIRNMSQAWRWFAWGCCAALIIQVIIGIGQVAAQSTNFSMLLGLRWPGSLTADLRGASVVQLIEGTRWLRAYGTLPHPNILGGFVFVLLSGPILLSLTSVKQKIFHIVLFGVGVILLMLTFSRSAWLGLGVFALFILFNFRRFQLRRLIILGLVGILCVTVVIVPLRSLFFTRLGDEQAQTEQASTFTRLWLLQRTVELIGQQPWLGTGIGSYSLALSQHVALSYDIEPVHNVPLLALSELGVGGFTLVMGLGISIAWRLRNRRTPEAAIVSGVVIGLLTISLLDHYLWTLAPGRILFGAILGLWANHYKKGGEPT